MVGSTRAKYRERHGYGIYTYPDGSIYEGEWEHDNRNGRGIYTYADGGKYEGGWKDNKKSGQGTRIWVCGAKYEGEWTNDKRNGQGTQTYSPSCICTLCGSARKGGTRNIAAVGENA
jgi:hypothetical protein